MATSQTALAEVMHESAQPLPIRLISLTVVSGTNQSRCTTITLDIGGRHKTKQLAVEQGGPVHAAVQAIKAIVPHELEFLSCNTKSVTRGSDSQARATVQVRQKGCNFIRGVDFDTDTVVASVKAYLKALNKYLAGAV